MKTGEIESSQAMSGATSGNYWLCMRGETAESRRLAGSTSDRGSLGFDVEIS